MTPDYYHNRMIDDKDRDRAMNEDIFYFWINDDDDQGDLEGSDIPGASRPDWDNAVVDGTRDLEDFFPVSLNLVELLDIYLPWQYHYRLKAVGENLNIAFTDLTPTDSGNYLTAEGTNMTREIVFSKAETVPVTKAGIDLFKLKKQGGRQFMERLRLQEQPGVILVEGRKAGTTPLLLEITDVNGNKVFSSQLNLSLAGVEMMFRQKNLIQPLFDFYQTNAFVTPDHVPTTALGPPDRLKLQSFVDAGQDYSAHFSGFEADNDGNDFVFVHGYNTNGEEARGSQTEIFKRMYWSGSHARFLGVTWYGWDSQSSFWQGLCAGKRAINYHINVRHAYYTGQLLKQFVASNNLSNATFAAHSLGNMVMASAIKNGMNYRQYFMTNAAVPEEAFIPQIAYADDANWATNTGKLMYHPDWRYPNGDPNEEGYKPFLWATEWYKRFDQTDYRQSMTWRDFFGKVTQNQGKGAPTYNFYSTNDEVFRPFTMPLQDKPVDGTEVNIDRKPGLWEVLKNISCTDVSRVGTYSWSLQELLKGLGGLTDQIDLFGTDSRFGGWGFNDDPADGYYRCVPPETVDGEETCGRMSPAEAQKVDPLTLKAKPLFSKNLNNSFLYSADPLPEQSVTNAEAKRIELLANEFPALTYAAGHRGVSRFDREFNIDIRGRYIKGGRWPRKRIKKEWRHNDIYSVGYPYLYGMYDYWARLIDGGNLQ
ncbi:MAG: hypothetical protein L3J63_06445 [Geopsychrobacter sp.]|nr:hypothetical protein [Geopsychrobacter sp.]